VALANQGWFIEVTFVGRGGRSVRRAYQMVHTDGGNNSATIHADATSFVTHLAGATECKITGYRLYNLWLETVLTLPTSAEAEVGQVALLTPRIRGNPHKRAKISIPGPKITLFKAQSGADADEIDPADTTLVSLMGDFDSTSANLVKVSDGEQIDRLSVEGRRSHKNLKRE